ncbi:hypothetical protein QQ020_00375 [Fulvivirgaceae bacterium BMA12]|uniref:Uncharacterized protein n=1 Tax=Agaribacillus aureus TaxID=3051825 RepID=A0ABT8L0W0_9BACT|nr:hypothetical protein [Fulvivirgaceae bacterium BMA12]
MKQHLALFFLILSPSVYSQIPLYNGNDQIQASIKSVSFQIPVEYGIFLVSAADGLSFDIHVKGNLQEFNKELPRVLHNALNKSDKVTFDIQLASLTIDNTNALFNARVRIKVWSRGFIDTKIAQDTGNMSIVLEPRINANQIILFLRPETMILTEFGSLTESKIKREIESLTFDPITLPEDITELGIQLTKAKFTENEQILFCELGGNLTIDSIEQLKSLLNSLKDE